MRLKLTATAVFPAYFGEDLQRTVRPERERECWRECVRGCICYLDGEMVISESSEGHRTASRRANRRPTQPLVGARVPLRRLLRVVSVACGIQFGWAMQLSLLTPYIQELSIPHAWSSLMWLCGPVSGLFVQSLVGHMSNRCTSRYGFVVVTLGLVPLDSLWLVCGFSTSLTTSPRVFVELY